MSLKRLKNFLNYKLYLDKIHRSSDDLYALQTIHKFFPENSYLPFTPFSLNPYTIVHILNDILFNDRKQIIEFGTGISTIIISRFIEVNKLSTQILSIDHNKEWQNKITDELLKYVTQTNTQMIHAELIEHNNETYGSYGNKVWYDNSVISENLNKKETVDLIIVDGPSTSTSTYARYPALHALKNQLADEFVVFLDDTKRKGEKDIAQKWSEIFNAELRFEKMYATISVGENFTTRPLSH